MLSTNERVPEVEVREDYLATDPISEILSVHFVAFRFFITNLINQTINVPKRSS